MSFPAAKHLCCAWQAVDGSVVPELVSVRYREGQAGRTDANLTSFGKNDFRYEFASINSMTEAEIYGGDAVLGPITLRPADRPRITDLKLTAQHPLEKQPTTYNFNGESDLSFLPRTHVRLEFTANTPIAEAHIKSSTTQPAQADLKQIDAEHFAMEWTHNSAVNLDIELVSRDARLTSAVTTVTVGLKVDQPPRVTIGYTGVKLRVTAKAKIPLTIDARDDYGVALASLIAKTDAPDPANAAHLITSTITTPLYGPANPAVETEIQPRQDLELEPLKIAGWHAGYRERIGDRCVLHWPANHRVACSHLPHRRPLRNCSARFYCVSRPMRAKFRKQADEVRSMREQMNLAITTEAVQSLAHRHRAMQHEVTRITTSLAESLTENETESTRHH